MYLQKFTVKLFTEASTYGNNEQTEGDDYNGYCKVESVFARLSTFFTLVSLREPLIFMRYETTIV